MTAQVRRKPKHLQAVMADAMAARVTATPDPATAQAIVVPAQVIAATVSRVVISQTVASVRPVWAIPLSAPNAKPWSVPRCRCANWRPKPMARP
jgi:hypothetical protein